MASFSRLAQIGYVAGMTFILSLLVWPTATKAQPFGVSTGYRATPALPTFAFVTLSGSGSSSGSGGGIAGFAGGSGSSSGSFSTQINYIHPGNFLPNNGQIIGMPPPTFMPMMTNAMSDTAGSPFAMLSGMLMGGGIGIGGVSFSGMAGAIGGGGGAMGLGGGLGAGGGMGGFAGKGMGGFNGKNAM